MLLGFLLGFRLSGSQVFRVLGFFQVLRVFRVLGFFRVLRVCNGF